MSRLLPTLVLTLTLALPSFAADPPGEPLPPPRSEPLPAPTPVLPPPTPVPAPQVILPPSIIHPPGTMPPPFVEPANPFGLPPVVYTRVSGYEVWQNLAVDRNGRWRPVVIEAPGGSYYRYNGAPYPWTRLNPRLVMPYIQN